jgi:hypothetical protein
MKIELDLGVTDFPVALAIVDGNDINIQPFIINAISKEEAIGKALAFGKKHYPSSRVEVAINPVKNPYVTDINKASISKT